MTGIPGVGKTTLLAKIVENLQGRNKSVTVMSFGTLMFEIAQKNGLKDRDDLRKLPVKEQQSLQKMAAEKIAAKNDEIVIIDTHAFINSPEGYYPGLPEHVLKIIKPTNFVSISAKTRNRDKITLVNIKKELEYQSGMISACAVITGSPVRHILNDEGKVDEAVDKIISSIGL